MCRRGRGAQAALQPLVRRGAARPDGQGLDHPKARRAAQVRSMCLLSSSLSSSRLPSSSPRLLVVLSARADVSLRLSSSVILSSSRRRLVGARSGPAVVVVEAPPSPRVLKRPQHTQLKTSHHSRLDLRVGSGRVRATAVAQAPTLPRGDAAAALPHVRRRPLQVAVHVHRGHPDRDAGASSSVAWD